MRLSAEMYNQVVGALKSDSKGVKDKRGEPRVGLSGDAPFVSVTDAGKRVSGSVRVRDVSRSGLGLIATHELPAAQRFVVQLQFEDEKPLWLVCFSAYCRAIEGRRFLVGARIDQVLNAEQIQTMEQKNLAAAANAASAMAASTPGPMRQQTALGAADIARISKAILG